MQQIEIKQDTNVEIRDYIIDSDRSIIKQIVESTGLFSKDEILIALELADETLAKGVSCGYHFLFAVLNEQVLGFTCYGPIPGCEKRHEVYWIAVEKIYHRFGIGRLLLRKTEEAIIKKGAERAYIETSSRADYQPTHNFYLASGYCPIAELLDYFRDGDGKIIFMKQLPVSSRNSLSLTDVGVSAALKQVMAAS